MKTYRGNFNGGQVIPPLDERYDDPVHFRLYESPQQREERALSPFSV